MQIEREIEELKKRINSIESKIAVKEPIKESAPEKVEEEKKSSKRK